MLLGTMGTMQHGDNAAGLESVSLRDNALRDSAPAFEEA